MDSLDLKIMAKVWLTDADLVDLNSDNWVDHEDFAMFNSSWRKPGQNTGGWEIDGENSPCIDAGDPVSDYTLEPAPNGDTINMGAYGNTIQASKSAL